MSTIGGLLAFLSVLMVLVSFVGVLIGGIPRIGIKSRSRAVHVMLGSFVLFVVGTLMAKPEPSATNSSPTPRPPSGATRPAAAPPPAPKPAPPRTPTAETTASPVAKPAAASAPTASALDLMTKAVEARTMGDLQKSLDILNDLVARFPASPQVRDARAKIKELNKAIATQTKKEAKDFATVEKLTGKASPAESLIALDEFEKLHRPGAFKEHVEKLRDELKAAVEAEQKASAALAKLGLEISSFQSYWTVDPNILGGEAVLAPYMRFKVKNLLQEPLTHLAFSATFDLVDKKEQLGSGETFVVGHLSGTPIKPGYSKEVFFGSETGYSGPGAAIGRPNVSVDLYVEVNDGPKTLVKQFRLANRVR